MLGCGVSMMVDGGTTMGEVVEGGGWGMGEATGGLSVTGTGEGDTTDGGGGEETGRGGLRAVPSADVSIHQTVDSLQRCLAT